MSNQTNEIATKENSESSNNKIGWKDIEKAIILVMRAGIDDKIKVC
jgi:hypothetical protein